uniref:Uncharacterized protein n=1 Tax=Anguilla anguilla TaxID=7936 RepID=A0A0E9T8G6_ANGAN
MPGIFPGNSLSSLLLLYFKSNVLGYRTKTIKKIVSLSQYFYI